MAKRLGLSVRFVDAVDGGVGNPETDPWVITGAMKVNRILKPSEVDALVRKAGR
ncbi:MAG: hypothetical protein IKZ14_05245 [Muribaculaceae bacterium]|nr:hypothetical protein [Muribaculaceae bacterium]